MSEIIRPLHAPGPQPPSMVATVSQLDRLNAMCSFLWGNTTALLHETLIEGHNMSYLDLGGHFQAFQTLLNLSNPKILIRKEYLIAYQHLEESQTYCTGCVLIGQPGIGKTFFLIYALIERLRARQPVAFHNKKSHYFMFTEEGVSQRVAGDSNPFDVPSTWALSNSSTHATIPPEGFLISSNTFIVQATSPTGSRWKEWKKQRSAGVFYMDVWDKDELAALAPLLDRKEMTPDTLIKCSEKYGPSPRNLIQILTQPNGEEEIEGLIMLAATSFGSSRFMSARSLDGINIEDFPSALIFLRPRLKDGVIRRVVYDAWIPTPYLLSHVADALKAASAGQQANFFSMMSSHVYSCSSAGWLFEGWVHTRFTIPPGVPCLWQNTALGEQIPYIPRTTRIYHLEDAAKDATSPFYWQPLASITNFSGIDAILFDGRVIYAIQAAIYSNHKGPKDGLDKALKDLSKAYENLTWRFIFVAPTERCCNSLLESMKPLTGRWEDIDVGGCVITLDPTSELDLVLPTRLPSLHSDMN